MLRTTTLAAALFSLAAQASAMNMQNFQVASDLGGLLASEEICELSYDHYAIDAFIDAKVDHSDMGFASMLAGQIALAEFTQQDQSPATRRAHCRAITATARQHGFID